MSEITLKPYGSVELIDFMGGDLRVYNAAQVSFAKQATELSPRAEGVINFMMRERHGSPFEHSVFSFRIVCPIFVAREWFRHRVASYNEWSGRYSELLPEFHLPRAAYTQVGKPGKYEFEEMSGYDDATMRFEIEQAYEVSWGAYQAMLSIGVAKELARVVLPVGIHTQFIWTVNARALMNFLNLRNAMTAQMAIREYAGEIEDHFFAQMPVTHAAFLENSRVAP